MDIRGFEIVSSFAHKGIQMPKRSTAESAGYDLAAAETVTVPPHGTAVVYTGLKAFMNYDEYLAIHIRSSLAFKRNLMLINSTGIIDSDYYNNPDNEGHIMISLRNMSGEAVEIEKGERIAQAIFSKYLLTNDDDAFASRKGGIGSTGSK